MQPQAISLLPYNSFHIDVSAANVLGIQEAEQLRSLPKQALRVLGGGSNILLTKNVDELLLLNRLKGIQLIKEDEDHVWLDVASGENWHEFVLYAIGEDLSGIENLALIPGTVGAAPMQNIGAYGVEAKETIESVTFWHFEKESFQTLENAACRFGYRESIFKHELSGKVFITSVRFKLNKKAVFKTSYGAISEELTKMNVTELSVRAIADAVIAIRSSKLPDPKDIGNAGSFFKNPTIPISQYEDLLAKEPGIPSYHVDDEMIKVPAGWLIEQCGWKGFRRGDAGVHAKQALVLVNYGHANGTEIWDLSTDILQSVKKRFGIELEREVNVW